MIDAKLISIVKDVFPTAQFDDTRSDLQVGSFGEWDSLGHFNLLLAIEDAYGIRFSTEEMTELKSLEAIEQSLKRKTAKPS